MRDKQGAAAIGLYSFFAEHIDPTCGAVVCDQQFLANQMGVSTRTIRRWLDYLEEKGALVRIPVAGKVCAYALDPPTKSGRDITHQKTTQPLLPKTLVNKDGEIKRRIMAMFSGEEAVKSSSEATLDGSGTTPPSERGWFATASHPHNNRPLSSRSHK